MTKTKIWLSSPHMGGTEQEYVQEAFDTNWIAPLGPNVNGFEQAIEAFYTNKVHVAALSSGTAAIHMALVLLGVKKNDEVICQSFTFSASANPIEYLGARPIFVDSERETWNISPELLEEAIINRIANGTKPKAIIAVHLYGMPYKAKEIKEISERYNSPVVEDSAEALGSQYFDDKCGSLGNIGILSFNGNKIITTSGGGAMVCNSLDHKKEAVHLVTQARDIAPHYEHSKVGYNYRMSNVLAGIGRGQMEVLNDRVLARRGNYEFYTEALKEYNDITFLPEPEGFYSNRWLSCMLTSSFEQREEIRLALAAEEIESRPLWKPMHDQPVYSKCMNFLDGTSSDLFNRGLCLPSGSNLSKDDLNSIVTIIKNILSK